MNRVAIAKTVHYLVHLYSGCSPPGAFLARVASRRPAGLDALVLALALLNAIIYVCLLPLWEGFDEPFHYGYVQWLASGRGLPRLGAAFLSAETWNSLQITPVSHVVHRNLPSTVTFDAWFTLPESRRTKLRNDLYALHTEWRTVLASQPNYEAHQAPLAYALMVPLELLTSNITLPNRVLLLRLFIATISVILTFHACTSLCRVLGISGLYQTTLLTCVFETQMFWATIARIANDWLAVPIAIALITRLAKLGERFHPVDAMVLSCLLSIGLLTKSYFLAFVPPVYLLLIWSAFCSKPRHLFAVSMALPLALAGPWYLRNWLFTNTISGMQEVLAGTGIDAVFRAGLELNWLETSLAMDLPPEVRQTVKTLLTVR